MEVELRILFLTRDLIDVIWNPCSTESAVHCPTCSSNNTLDRVILYIWMGLMVFCLGDLESFCVVSFIFCVRVLGFSTFESFWYECYGLSTLFLLPLEQPRFCESSHLMHTYWYKLFNLLGLVSSRGVFSQQWVDLGNCIFSLYPPLCLLSKWFCLIALSA